MKIEGFIFDLDGVLTDTASFHNLSWKHLAEDEGLIFTEQDGDAVRGVSRRESLLIVLKGRVVPEAQMLEMMERKNRYYQELVRLMTPADILPGALELLQEIRQAGLKIAIGSASKNAPLVLDLLGLRPWIDVVIDGNIITKAKPAPDLFLEAAHRLGLPPAACVVVEDAQAGVEAGLAGGMRTIGLGPVERVGAATLVLPDLSNAHLKELLELLEARDAA